MAQFNSLLVTGESRFINPINGNARNGVYTVIGTQTASTSAWTGKIDVPALYDGLRIAYYLPYASTSTAVTLNLTLSTGTTTGAVNCYYSSTERITEQFKVSNTIIMTYYSAGSISISGTATTDNRWIAETGTDENVYQEEITSGSNRRVVLGSVFGYGSGTSRVYTNPNFYFSPSLGTLTLQYDNSIDSPKIELNANHTNFYNSWVEFSDELVALTGSTLSLDSDSFISGDGCISIDNDIGCTSLTDYTTNVTKATNDIVTQTGIYTVIGTQTASTNKFTGVLPLSALYDGLTINYYIPYAPTSSNATLNLTLSDGTTTGEKNLYISTSRFTSHIGAGRTAVMTYWSAGSISISGTPTTDDRWVCDGYYDTNDVVTLRSQYPRVTTGVNGIKRNSLFTKTLDGTYTSFFSGTGGTGVTKTYDFTTYYYPRDIWYHQNSSDVAANTVTGNGTIDFQHSLCDLRYSVSGITSSASTSTLVANKPVYIMFDKNSENCGYYRLKDPVWTQTPSDPDAIYTLVAYAYDVYRCDLWVNNPVFTFDGTTLIPFESSYTSILDQTSFASYNSTVNTNLAECLVTIQTIQNGVSPTPTTPKALIGFDTTEVYVAGTNLWNEKWEVGGIDQTAGLDDSATNRIRSIGFTAVKPDVEYYAYTDGYPCRIFFYDATKTFISNSSVSLNNHVFSTPADCYYIRFITDTSYGTTYLNDLSFNYPSSDTTYHKYAGSVSTAALGQTIYGAKLNFLTGEMTITHEIADIGDLNVGYNATEAIFYVTINGKENTEKNYVKCSCFAASNQAASGLADAKSKLTANKSCIASYTTTNPRVYIRWDECTNTTTFTSTLAGQKIVYELATPITVQLSPNTVKQILGTNYVYANCGDVEIAYINRTIPAEAITNNSLLNLSDTSISDVQPCDILTYDGYNWRNTNNIALKDTNRHTTINLNGDTGLITSGNSPSTGGQIVTDVAIGGFTTGSGDYFKFSLPFANTATSAAIISLDQSNSKLMLPSAVLQTSFIDLSNSTVSSITKDWITFEFKLSSTQAANTPGTILLASFEFELY